MEVLLMQSHIWKLLFVGSLLFAAAGCATPQFPTPTGFSYQKIPVTSESVGSGESTTVLFRGTPLPLIGSPITVGETLRSVPVTSQDLSIKNISEEIVGTVRIISIVPSLDTKVCEQQTHYLSEKNGDLDSKVRLITISIDTPFAQKRFAEEAEISNVEFLSDYRGAQFGKAHGLFLEGPHVLSRAVLVVDSHNTIRHLQITPDLGHLPNMDKAFQIARTLVK